MSNRLNIKDIKVLNRLIIKSSNYRAVKNKDTIIYIFKKKHNSQSEQDKPSTGWEIPELKCAFFYGKLTIQQAMLG